MPSVLILAPSGFGKTTSMLNIPDLGIEGLNPAETYLISCSGKPLPAKGSNEKYKVTISSALGEGNRVISTNPEEVAFILFSLVNSPFQNIVVDDMNYLMQDYYMDNALEAGWDAPKKIGFDMGKIFKAITALNVANKNIIVLAHGENVTGPDGRTYIKYKTTGKMVDDYVTPEGKFETTLLGISQYDHNQQKVTKQFLTRENERYSSAKSPHGLFEEMLIPNDLGYVVKKMKEYY